MNTTLLIAAALALTAAADSALAQINVTHQSRRINGMSSSTAAGITDDQGPFSNAPAPNDLGIWTGDLTLPGFISGTASQSGGYDGDSTIQLESFAITLGGGNGPDTSAHSTLTNEFTYEFIVDTARTFTFSADIACAGPGGPPLTVVDFSVVIHLTGPSGDVFRYTTAPENGFSISVSDLAGAVEAGAYTLSCFASGFVSFEAPPDMSGGNGAGGGAGGTQPIMTFTIGGPACPADWDGSGGIDGDDIAAFFIDWQQGIADIDQSGGTDGDDITFFFDRWQAGC